MKKWRGEKVVGKWRVDFCGVANQNCFEFQNNLITFLISHTTIMSLRIGVSII